MLIPFTENGNPIDVTQGGNAYVNPNNNNDYSFSLSNSESQTLYIQNTLTYHWGNEWNDLTLMLGNEVSRWYGQWTSANARGFESADIRDLGLTNQPSTKQGSGALNLETRGISYFGRANYSLFDRYLLTATVRRDGSSNFGAGNRWGTFPSVAAGWRISEESFLKDTQWLNNLKLRAGWGQTGNSGGATDRSVYGISQNGTQYVYYGPSTVIGPGSGLPNTSVGFFTPLVDTNLKWETNEQTNIGIDMAFLNNEFNLTLDYFIRTSKDLLLYRNIRPSTGYVNVYTNYGEIENKGLEFSLNYNKRLNSDWSISATLTGSTLKNKVKKMGDPIYNTNSDSSGQGTGDGSNTGAVGADAGYHWGNHSICMEGEAVGSYYGFECIGIYRTEDDLKKYPSMDGGAKLGDLIFRDIAGAFDEDGNPIPDGQINADDMKVLGNGFAKLNYGINVTVNYKNFDFTLYGYGVAGQKILSYSAMRLTNMFGTDDGCSPNILKEAAAAAWSPSNPNGTEARLSIIDTNYNMRVSDHWIKNGDFFKISNLQIGYTLPKNILNQAMIQNARLYFAIQNLCCISKYNKYGDPECGQGSVLYTGLDTGRYPMPRTYAFGLNVTF